MIVTLILLLISIIFVLHSFASAHRRAVAPGFADCPLEAWLITVVAAFAETRP